MRAVKTESIVPGKKGGFDMQQMATPMVVPKTTPSTQQIDFGQMVMKTDRNNKSYVGVKMSLECMTHGYTGGHH